MGVGIGVKVGVDVGVVVALGVDVRDGTTVNVEVGEGVGVSVAPVPIHETDVTMITRYITVLTANSRFMHTPHRCDGFRNLETLSRDQFRQAARISYCNES